jgi:hypothetical protein
MPISEQPVHRFFHGFGFLVFSKPSTGTPAGMRPQYPSRPHMAEDVCLVALSGRTLTRGSSVFEMRTLVRISFSKIGRYTIISSAFELGQGIL